MTDERDTRGGAQASPPASAGDGGGAQAPQAPAGDGGGGQASPLAGPVDDTSAPAEGSAEASRVTPPARPAPQEPGPGESAAAEQNAAAGEPAAEAPEAAELAADAPAAAEPDAAELAADEPAAAEPAAPEPDYRDQWLRAAADLENFRKRARRDLGAAEARGIARLARELLPALDNFERALDAAEAQPENQDHHLTDGIRLVQNELLAALARVGIEPESPKGQPFDPHRHEAVAQQPVEGAEPGTIVEVLGAGYLQGDDVLRAAKVVVAG